MECTCAAHHLESGKESRDLPRSLTGGRVTHVPLCPQTPANATSIPGGPIDYASKHWSGLVADYYGVRAKLTLEQALKDAAAGHPLDTGALNQIYATHAYTWTTATNAYPTAPVGDALAVSKAMYAKYAPYYASCSAL